TYKNPHFAYNFVCRLPFRSLVRKYDCDLCFTPMILADSFVMSEKARNNEFTTSKGDRPLIVQFAANNINDFTRAAEMVSPYSDGVDLNCGCPQRWAMKDGYGADLLSKPELIRDLVLSVRNRIPRPFSVSVKVRLLPDVRKSIDLCQSLESAGVTFITVHARTPQQKHQPINVEALKEVTSRVRLPIIGNGDVRSLQAAQDLHDKTGCRGVMAARGLLTNPAMFSGAVVTPVECVQQWLCLTSVTETHFNTLHHHLVFMLEKVLPKPLRLEFNSLKTRKQVLDFLAEHLGVEGSAQSGEGGIIQCDYTTEGSYFTEAVKRCDSQESLDDYLQDACTLYCT
ncbi:unnamed protein product, partial [Timema podura]|nr:unnamed protein product [Timema podura]